MNEDQYNRCAVYIDSQTAIKAIERPQRQSGQTIIKELLDCIDEIISKYTHPQIEIVWIPGHSEIQGNERADAEAKKVTADPTLTQLRRHRPLKSARIRYIKSSSKGTVAQGLE